MLRWLEDEKTSLCHYRSHLLPVCLFFFSHSLLEILDFDWSIFLHDVEKTEKFFFLLLVFSMSMTCLLALFWRGIEELSLRKMQANLKRLLAGQEVVQVVDPDLDASFKSLSGKLNLLTEALQKAENHSLAQEEEIIEKERKRIAGICTIQSVRSCLRPT